MPMQMDYIPTPLEQMIGVAAPRRKVTIGLPAPQSERDRRFPLTPESAGLLVERGFVVKMEAGAANDIHYDDLRYQEHGIEIVDRAEAFRCDIVISLSRLSTIDARSIRRGAMLLSFFHSLMGEADVLRILLRNHVMSLALDLIRDNIGHRPFADILAEIAGRAAIAMAASLLSDSVNGKGILLGGVAGIVPCEVTIIGSGIDAISAARSALGLGAMVRMFDSDVYRLRQAIQELGPGVVGSAMHPGVLLNALRSADVAIATPMIPHHVISADAVAEMKQGVVTFDISGAMKPAFPSLKQVDLGAFNPIEFPVDGKRVCYVNPAGAVPRTVAMALSNTLLTMLNDIFTCDGLTNALMLNDGLQRAALTFLGKAVNPGVAAMLGLRAVDIKLMLQFS